MFHWGCNGICVLRDGRVATSDDGSHEIHLFSAAGECLKSFGSHGAKVGEFRVPWGCAEIKTGILSGKLLIADQLNERVQVLDIETGSFHAFPFDCNIRSPRGVATSRLQKIQQSLDVEDSDSDSDIERLVWVKEYRTNAVIISLNKQIISNYKHCPLL